MDELDEYVLVPPRRFLAGLLEAICLVSGAGCTSLASVITIEDHIKFHSQNYLVLLPGYVACLAFAGFLVTGRLALVPFSTASKRVSWVAIVVLLVGLALGVFGIWELTVNSEPYTECCAAVAMVTP
jgi:hypothetical protein